MQRIYPWESTIEQYVESEGHRQVEGERVCPRCRRAGRLHRHGGYSRWVTNATGAAVAIIVARFLCQGCERTVSYLPSFALSYRLVRTATVEAFLDGRHEGRDVQAYEALLRAYRRRMQSFAREMIRVVGFGLGLDPPPVAGLWRWLKEACGGLAAATRQLVTHFRVTTLRRYQCHQPAV